MFNTNEIPFEQSLLQVRFIGELDGRSVPIYDLGISLIAIQRMIHKAYLAQQGYLEDTSHLSERLRLELSFQIGSRKNASDGYGLIPILSDPDIIKSIEIILPLVFNALGQYVFKRMENKKVETKRSENKASNDKQENTGKKIDERLFTGSIYGEVIQVAERIENKGIIEQVEISTNRNIENQKLKIDRGVKEYLKSLKNYQIFGEYQEIEGTVKTIDEFSNIVEIKISPRRVIKVHLTDDDFEAVRYLAKREAVIAFWGTPVLLLGQNRYKAFEAHSIRILN